MHYDAIIIGAGMSGLAAGIRLAHFEKKVVILEQHSLWGGLNSFYKQNGIRFDVGLHAMTNFVVKGTKRAPLSKLLRQLRIPYEAFDLHEQQESKVVFPGATLIWNNDFAAFCDCVRDVFPRQADSFNRLVTCVQAYDELDLSKGESSARAVLARYLSEPLLIEMLFCPILYYGSARENDIDWGQFVVMFKSLFCEGLARPHGGVRTVLNVIRKKYLENGGELRLRTGVQSIKVDADKRVVTSLVLENGEELTADMVLSSAGLYETLRMCSDRPDDHGKDVAGRLSFTETIHVLDRPMHELGFDTTILFYNDSDKFDYRQPDDAVDLSSAVICCPDNFRFTAPLETHMIRVTHIARWDRWNGIAEDDYVKQKDDWRCRSLEKVLRYVPDFREHVTYVDSFTPRTIHHYTRHINGAVYGASEKVRDGQTHLDNLFICGTDQGFLGIVGAMLSGISIANKFGLGV